MMFLNLDMMIYIVVNKRPAHFALVPGKTSGAKVLKSYYILVHFPTPPAHDRHKVFLFLCIGC